MKFLDRLVLKLFALIVGVLTILIVLAVTGIIPMEYITDLLVYLTDGTVNLKITLVVSGVILLLVLKALCFPSKPESDGKDGVVLENNNGKLVISKESLENLIASVIKDVPGADTVSSRTILDKDKNLIVYVTAIVSKDVMLKDITNEVQSKIKLAMKRTADLEVKEVNVKIKNITSKRVKGLPSPTEEENNEEVEKETEVTTDSEENKVEE